MCGIVGGVFRTAFPSSDVGDAFDAATRTLSHRGPDDHGILVLNQSRAVLGFRRLSIIDLATGHQPMSTGSGQHIVFNGEIYNYRAMREQLEAQGEVFRTSSDTEVLLRELARSGIDALTRLQGMWGFGFLDTRARRLWLARDRLGVKQLYYSPTDQGIFFASEPKALLALPWVQRQFDAEYLADYLTFRAVPAPDTLFRGIKKLAPGTVLEHDLESWTSRIHRYWKLPSADRRPTIPLRQAVSVVEQTLLAAVERRLVSDVPLGALLSGGLDSSLVVAAMRRLGHSDIRTFSAVFPGSPNDESSFSRRVAREFGTHHHERATTAADFLASLPSWVELNDDLVADASSLPLLLVSHLACSSGCKVLLSGEGADELFGGYGSYHKYLLLNRAASLVPHVGFRRTLVNWLVRGRLLGAQDRPRADEYFVRSRAYLGTAALWGPTELPTSVLGASIYEPPRADGNTLRALGAFDFERRIPDDLLVRTDRATMGSSVEARVPFLDHELVEVVNRLPSIARALPGMSKTTLRTLAWRWKVPLSTVTHRKIGFQVPLGEWFRNELRSLWDRILTERMLPGLAYDRVGQILAAHLAREGHFEEMLWRIAALELWYRRWIVGDPTSALLAR